MGKLDPAFPVLEVRGGESGDTEVMHLGMNQLALGSFLVLQGLLQNEKLLENLLAKMKRERTGVQPDGLETVANPKPVTPEEFRAEVARQAALYAEDMFEAVTNVVGDKKL